MAKKSKGQKATAVVFVHGQGEQAPMDDLLQLAFSVWETDPRAAQGAQLGNIASVPQDQADVGDLRRLITGRDQNGRQYHFYQFYWAHLMPNNKLLDLWRWLVRLMGRPKAEIPAQLSGIRRMLMAAAGSVIGVAFLFASFGALRLVGPIDTYGAIVSDGYAAIWALSALYLMATVFQWRRRLEGLMVVSVSVVVAGMMFGTSIENLVPGDDRFLKGDGFPAATVWRPNAAVQDLVCVIDVNPKPSSVRKYCDSLDQYHRCKTDERYRSDLRNICSEALKSDPRNLTVTSPITWWALAAAGHRLMVALGGVVYLVILIYWQRTSVFLKTVMTDSARYFSNDPENVAQRDVIRRKGVELLEQLHASKEFDRIIVVAHSLGTVVAYNMLDHYWGSVRTRLRGGHAQQKALLDVGSASVRLDDAVEPDVQARLAEFRRAQRRYSRRLSRLQDAAGDAWLVSDLITLGSPLTYAKLLMVDSVGEFTAKMNKFYRLPACPPVSGEDIVIDGQVRRKLCDSWLGEALGDVKAPLPAAVFAATRWTNIYFTNNGLSQGDIVGGPVAPAFGRGVVDVKIDRARLGRGFLHNEYWKWPDQSKASAWQAAGETRSYTPAPHHIARLRQAVNLFENPQSEVQLMTPDAVGKTRFGAWLVRRIRR